MSCVMLYWLEKKVHIVVHRRYIEMEMGMLIFLGFAIVGLILLVTGIVFLLKNIKWRKEKEERGLSQTINIVHMCSGKYKPIQPKRWWRIGSK